MKVDDPNLSGVAGAQTGRTPEAHEPNRPGSASNARISESVGGDHAEVSSLAGRISHTLTSHAAERTEQTAKLAEQYRTGQYNVNARSIGKAILRDAIERKTDGR